MRCDALFKVYARLDGAKHLIAGAKNATEELKFLVQELVDSNVGRIGLVQKVNDDDIELLPIAVAAADALLDPLRVPRQIIVHDEIAELQVDTFRGGFSRDHDRRFITEVFDKRGAHVSARRSADAIRAGVSLKPCSVDAARKLVAVRAVEKDNTILKFGLLQNLETSSLACGGTR